MSGEMKTAGAAYRCFADFEFTCGNKDAPAELLSVGLVICDADFSIAERYYATVKPIRYPRLNRRCIELTHLTQQEIDVSPDSETVLRIAVQRMQKYGIRRMEVWGDFDYKGLYSDFWLHRNRRREVRNIQIAMNSVYDVQPFIVRVLRLPEPVSISELSVAFGYQPKNGQFHNALVDAEALYTVVRAAHTTDFMNNPQFLAVRQHRRDKLNAQQRGYFERALLYVCDTEMSPESEAYFQELLGSGDELALRRFVEFRAKIFRELDKHDNADDFMMIVFDASLRQSSVIPAAYFIRKNVSTAARVIPIHRNEADAAVLRICREKDAAAARTAAGATQTV